MSFSLQISEDKQYIIMTLSGEINRRIAFEQNIEAHKLGREVGINKYLVDSTECTNTESPVDSYAFVNNDMKQTDKLDMNAVVAIWVRKDDHSHDFFETAAINAGMCVRIFRDKQKALEFLPLNNQKLFSNN